MRRLILLLTTLLALAAPGVAGARSTATTVPDGMRIGHLPTGLLASTDFTYEFDDVSFVSRVWESRTAGGRRVDLFIDVLRGAPLRSPAATHDWVIAYQERPPAEAVYRPTTVRGHAGWRCADEVFWQVGPGVAVIIGLDTTRWPRPELLRIARSVRAGTQ